MANETRITVIGNITADPEIKYTPNDGIPVANFTVASTSRVLDRQADEWRDKDKLFLRCSAWRDEAENIAQTLKKGMRVIVVGDLIAREYETKDGRKGTSMELNNVEVGPSLRKAAFDQKAGASGTNQNQGYSNNRGSSQNFGNQGNYGSRPQVGNQQATSEPPF